MGVVGVVLVHFSVAAVLMPVLLRRNSLDMAPCPAIACYGELNQPIGQSALES